MRLYGSKVYVRIPEQIRKSKWDDKASLGILLGYTEVGYKVLVNNRVINVRNVDIIENTKLISFDNTGDDNVREDISIESESSLKNDDESYQSENLVKRDVDKQTEGNKEEEMCKSDDQVVKTFY